MAAELLTDERHVLDARAFVGIGRIEAMR